MLGGTKDILSPLSKSWGLCPPINSVPAGKRQTALLSTIIWSEVKINIKSFLWLIKAAHEISFSIQKLLKPSLVKILKTYTYYSRVRKEAVNFELIYNYCRRIISIHPLVMNVQETV